MTTDLVRLSSTRQILSGIRYEALVPETLDLAERAHLAINAMTGAINEKLDYEYCWHVRLVPPGVSHHTAEWFDCNPRAAESLPYFRSITGSDFKIDLEEKMLASMLSRIDDGLYFNAPYRPEAPWRAGGGAWPMFESADEDVAAVFGNGELLIALLSRYQCNRDPALLAIARRMVDRLIEIAIYREDYAYYPVTKHNGLCGYRRRSGWSDTTAPLSEADCPEGAVTFLYSIVVRALCRYYVATTEARALELARQLVNFCLKPNFWGGGIRKWHESTAHAVECHGAMQSKPAALFEGHLTCLTLTFQGLIEYAIVANDATLKDFVRQGYEHMRNLGLARLGMWGENMANNFMAGLAIKLSDAGAGDYWDDVDSYVRNTMAEDQFVDAALLRRLCRERGVPSEVGEFSIERLLGCLRHHGMIQTWVLDPTQNGVCAAGPYLEGHYYAWEAITRCRDGAAQVNLLLNRASAALDIESHLPYEGKVVIRNKLAQTLAIRIPKWVDRQQLSGKVNDRAAAWHWVGNYLVPDRIAPGDVVTLQFPVVETRETHYLTPIGQDIEWYRHKADFPEYVLEFKGNTCLKVDFTNLKKFQTGSPHDPAMVTGYPVYQREHYRANRAPVKKVSRYVAPRVIEW